MNPPATPSRFRILLVDDNPAIHDDIRKILLGAQTRDTALDAMEAVLFNAPEPTRPAVEFEIDSAFQGREALEKVERAMADGAPYALAFVDVRMPPGWDGVETVEHLWKVDPALQAVICTAYSDYTWKRMADRLGASDNFVILRKPFDNIEVLQLAHALTRKWHLTREAQQRLQTLDQTVHERTAALQLVNTELRRSEERFATTFHASPLPVAIQRFDDHRFVDANAAFLRITEFSRDELVGRAPLELALCIDYDPTAPGATIGGEGSVRGADGQISTKSGDLRNVRISVERITLGGEAHLLLMAEDVSDQQALEGQVREAQKLEAIGQLASGVAHDFNNLLTIIQGHASLQLAGPDLAPELRASFAQIEQAAARAAELTRQLLAFSRRQILRPQPTDLAAVVEKVGTTWQCMLPEEITLHIDAPPGLPPACVDPGSIEQVISHLVSNARDAMSDGGRLTLAVEPSATITGAGERHPNALAGDYLCIRVSDTGSGMDETTRTRIFEPFFTTKEVRKGTGMGLATVHGIVQQHGGWVEVETAPGAGSTFRVFLPTSAAKAAEAICAQALAPAVARRERTILVVEDDHSVRELVREVLTQNDYRVLEADSADAALPMWQRHATEVDLLLTDIVMPGSANGLELARQLLVDRPDLRVIYTSGYSADLFTSDIALKDGVNYLPKPYPFSKLTTILRSALAAGNS